MLDKLTSGDFTPYLNQTFHIHVASTESLDAELIEVSELGAAPEADSQPAGRRAFSLVFRGSPDPILAQAIYRVAHSEMGSVDLFLVPIGSDTRGMRYEAVFT